MVTMLMQWLVAGHPNDATVTSLCEDLRCKEACAVETMQLVTNHRILAAVAPLSKGNLIKDKSLGSQSSRYKENSLPMPGTLRRFSECTNSFKAVGSSGRT